MQARCLLFEFQRRRYRAEDPSVGRNDFFNRLLTTLRAATNFTGGERRSSVAPISCESTPEERGDDTECGRRWSS